MAQFRPLTDAVKVAVHAPLGIEPSRTALIVGLDDADRVTTAGLELIQAGFNAVMAETLDKALNLLNSYPDVRAIVLVGDRASADTDRLNALLEHGRSVHASLFEIVGDKVRYGDPLRPIELNLRRRRGEN